MSRIEWDQVGSRTYEAGVNHGVLYTDYSGTFTNGVAWNGLTGIDCEDDDRESTPLYSGDIKAGLLFDSGGCSGTINAYTYPEEFESCIGSEEVLPGLYMQQQNHPAFGLSYRTNVGNDTAGLEHAYRLHLIYGAVVTSNSISRSTINDSAEALEFSWDFEAMPQEAGDYSPFSELIFDSRKFNSDFMDQLCDILYGTDETPARLPSISELVELFTVIDTSIPPEYEGYPYEYLYPSQDTYPQSTASTQEG